jgi:cell wall-associated NlpC family hydrolase
LAKWQALVGEDIEKENIQKGDLIFFEETPEWNIEHVGILIDKNNMVHAYSDKKKILFENPEDLIASRNGQTRIGRYMRLR